MVMTVWLTTIKKESSSKTVAEPIKYEFLFHDMSVFTITVIVICYHLHALQQHIWNKHLQGT